MHSKMNFKVLVSKVFLEESSGGSLADFFHFTED